jgi:hypothetical protein
VGIIKTTGPAFVNLFKEHNRDSWTYAQSSFSGLPFTNDYIYLDRNASSWVAEPSRAKLVTLTNRFVWPNEIDLVPHTVFNKNVLIASGGFLVPWKSTGAVALFDLDSGATVQITTNQEGYFYHRSLFYDVNGDGLMDVITARANKPIFGDTDGELLWLEHPTTDPFGGAWKMRMLVKGPDVFFCIHDLDGDGRPEIIAMEFFREQLVVYTFPDGYVKSESVIRTVVDTSLGSMFDASLVDIDGDGKLDLLTTNHVADPRSGVYVYEIPAGKLAYLNASAWVRHTIVDKIPTRVIGIGQASPGQATAFYPQVSSRIAGSPPHLLLSGDGSKEAYILSPTGSPFSYNCSVLVNAQGTVGKPAVADINFDGWADVFVPGYDTNQVFIYTFAP